MGFFEPDHSQVRAPVTVGSLLRAMRREAVLVALVVAVFAVLGVLATMVLTPTYKSSSVVEVQRTSANNVNPSSSQLTEAELARSIPVAEAVIAELGLLLEPDELIKKYTATVITDNVLRFDVQAPSSAEAVALADALAEAFLARRAATMQAQVAIVVDTLQTRIGEIDADLAVLDPQIQALSNELGNDINVALSRQIDELTNRRNQLNGERTDLIGRVFEAQLETSVALEASRLIAPGRPPKRPLFPSLKFDVPVAMFLGLVAGFSLVAAREVLSRRVRTRQEVASAAVAPVTIELPWNLEPRYRVVPARQIPRRWSASDRVRTSSELHWLLRAGEGGGGHLAIVGVGARHSAARLTAMFADELATRGDIVVVDAFPDDTELITAAFGSTLPGTVHLRTLGTFVPPVPSQTTARLVFLTPSSRLDWPVLTGTVRSTVMVVGTGKVTAQQIRSSSHELHALGMPVASVALVDPDSHDITSGYPSLPAQPAAL